MRIRFSWIIIIIYLPEVVKTRLISVDPNRVCGFLGNEDILLVSIVNPTGSGTPVNDCSVLHVPVLTE